MIIIELLLILTLGRVTFHIRINLSGLKFTLSLATSTARQCLSNNHARPEKCYADTFPVVTPRSQGSSTTCLAVKCKPLQYLYDTHTLHNHSLTDVHYLQVFSYLSNVFVKSTNLI